MCCAACGRAGDGWGAAQAGCIGLRLQLSMLLLTFLLLLLLLWMLLLLILFLLLLMFLLLLFATFARIQKPRQQVPHML